MQAMVIVEGDEGRGSGFLVKMDGKTFLVTNSHVVRGNRNVKFKNLRNAELVTEPLEIADRVDAVRAAVGGVTSALEIETQIEKVKIGDAVIVAGNSEGEGVVRELTGKVVGIGPDRIEVDAKFVPGNSGSPILLKATGKVIGVATYMKVSRGIAGLGSPFGLNEVRRFGYRIDTVEKWVAPQGKDRLQMEGLKLTEMENLMTKIIGLFTTNADYVAKWGSDRFVKKEEARQFPAFAALAQAIDAFAKEHAAGSTAESKARAAATFFGKIKELVTEDTRGLVESQFSGYYSVQLKESLEQYRGFSDFFEGTAMAPFREKWLSARTVAGTPSTPPSIDPAKFKLTLTDRVESKEPPDNCHHISYPLQAAPANTEGLFWVVVDPGGAQHAFQMHKTAFHPRTLKNGAYEVYVEFRGSDKPSKVVSNVIEIKYTADAAPPGDAKPAPGENNAKPPAEQ